MSAADGLKYHRIVLDSILDFTEIALERAEVFDPDRTQQPMIIEDGELYCAKCGGVRRMRLQPVWTAPRHGGSRGLSIDFQLLQNDRQAVLREIKEQLAPSLFRAACVQCRSAFTLLIYAGPNGADIAVLPEQPGGISTPFTPEGVAFYLDQAHRAHGVGAHSAALAMYRAALEHLLLDQGFDARMLGPKIGQLEKAIAAGEAPRWALDLDKRYLKVIKDLGNGSIHANAGDVSLQAEIDRDLVQQIQATFEELLEVIYEQEARRDARLSALEKTAALFAPRRDSAA